MSSVTKDIVFIYLSGHATVIQKRMIQEWLQLPENSETYYEWMEEWETKHTQFVPDVTIALQNFTDKIHVVKGEPETDVTVLPVSSVGRHRIYFSAAASVLLFVFAGVLYFSQSPLGTQEYTTAAGETKTITLSDSTIITLGPNSELNLAASFETGGDRIVELKGQGIFNVKHTIDNRPFFVNTPNEMQVAVLGTEFDLFASKDSNRIYLSQGSVKLYLDKNKADSIKMVPGDLVKVNSQKNVQVKTAQSYWQMQALQNHAMVFNETSLADISVIMNEQFGRNIIIADSALANRTISGSYKWTSVDEFMITLSEMMDFQLIKNGNELIVK